MPLMYSLSDQVTSLSALISADSIRGGDTKSAAMACSPTRTCHGNSPSTKTVFAVAVWKCRYEWPWYVHDEVPGVAPPPGSAGSPGSVDARFQWPAYSVM